jgi:drug/metabolite transporter (DMT)-like permease
VQRPLSSSSAAFRQQQQQHKQSHPFSLILPSTSTSTRITSTTTSATRLYVATSDTFRRAASQKARRSSTNSNNQQQQQQQQNQEASVVTAVSSTTAAASTAASTTTSASPQDIQDDIVYRNGLLTVGLITVLFASNSPAVHAAFSAVSEQGTPPVLLLNAAVACVALTSVRMGGSLLDQMIPDPSLLSDDENDSTSNGSGNNDASLSSNNSNNVIDKSDNNIQNWIPNISVSIAPATQAGMELGLWKFLGTTANLYGLSLTSAGHGAFLIQLTTFLVPAAQGFMGVAIPTRLWSAIALALSGVFLFTQDTGGGVGIDSAASDVASMVDSSSSSLDAAASIVMDQLAHHNHHSWQGDALCVVAAMFYATYDLRLFQWGQRVAPLQLITNKVTTQAALSVGLLALVTAFGSWNSGSGDSSIGFEPIFNFFTNASARDLGLVGAVALWSGMIVNGIVPYLQVGGQQAVGPARAQILYASQPLWAALMSYLCLGETVGMTGAVGGTAFLGAMMLAATAEQPSAVGDE